MLAGLGSRGLGQERPDTLAASADALLDAATWEAAPAEGVELRLAADRDAEGRPALRLDYDFHGRGGWAAARRRIALELPTDYELRFSLRGLGPPNNLEVKLVDESGENVWWHVRRDFASQAAWPAAWIPVRIKKRQIEFAWGPAGGGELRRTGAIELAVTAGSGGRGSVWIAGLELVPRAPAGEPVPPRAVASGAEKGHSAAQAIDGNAATAWRSAGLPAALTVDLGGLRELGGLTLLWEAGRAPRRFRVELSEDGESWTLGRAVERGGARRSDLLLIESEARFVRLRLGEDAALAADTDAGLSADAGAGLVADASARRPHVHASGPPKGSPRAEDTGAEGRAAKRAASPGLAEMIVRPLAFGASPNAFFQELAKEAPRGTYPRGFSGEQSYWTVVGADGDRDEGLFSEDGALEVGERGFSLEPSVYLGGRLWTWADVAAGQTLADGDLPIPTVSWPLPGARLDITALAWTSHHPPAATPETSLSPASRSGRILDALWSTPASLADRAPSTQVRLQGLAKNAGKESGLSAGPAAEQPPTGDLSRSALFTRYRLRSLSRERLRGRLFVVVRPFQVNPPQQFLNLAGGVSPLSRLACDGAALRVDSALRLWASPAPAVCGAAAFDEGPIHDLLRAGAVPASSGVVDSFGYATAALAWDFDLPPGEALEVVLGAPLAGGTHEAATATLETPARPANSESPENPANPETPDELANIAGDTARFSVLAEETRRSWREKLDRVTLDLPPEAAPLACTVRSSLAYILIHRDGPALQPGSRAYARSWIRDGALTGTALLRLGQAEAVREFAAWFAGFQYPDGKVPCCVDRRGADPVPEHDSHGELVHLITEVFRYTRDRDFAERLFPRVERAVDHIEALRQSRRTAEYRQGEKRAFFGLLPESISHEGYSAKPVHSYWDDGFAYRGLDDAVMLATALGRTSLAERWAARRDEFRADLLASIALVRERHGIDYLPGSAELGDFDSTSTTVTFDPGGLGPFLPRAAVDATFERFWRELAARRAGTREWTGYTPYEIRHIGAFVRLGWKERAHELLAYYLGERLPPGWNQWPEAVSRERRKPGFLGDLPHGWVASDYIRSVLDLFAYERRDDHSLVLAAGVPAGWLARPQGIAVRNLATPWGPLSYTLARRGGGVRYVIAADSAVPPGGLVLAWPLAGRPASALEDGRPAALAAGGTVIVRRAPATVDLLPGRADGPRNGEGRR